MKMPVSKLKVSPLSVAPAGYSTTQRPVERTRPNARLTPGATAASGFAQGRKPVQKPYVPGPLLGSREV